MRNLIKEYSKKIDMQFAYNTTHTLSYDPKYLLCDMGFRTAGSDAEHEASDYLERLMVDIGLSDVIKVPVKVDSWAFRGASLSLDGDDYVIKPASYASSGTDSEGINAPIVFLGRGYAKNYEGVDVKGKIVLIEIDQWNDTWISDPYREAYIQGASALVSYDIGGYAEIADDAINLQDICEENLIPCVSISNEDGLYLKDKILNRNLDENHINENQINTSSDNKDNSYKETALNNTHCFARLIVDSEVSIGDGVSYNVVGKIPGKSSAQQIIVAAHYDVYFNGFQDDCSGIGLVLAIAKALIESGYEAQNDILFVAHGAEEWGASGSRNDWTTGAWEMINTVNPSWAKKTLALINFELPALYEGDDYISISAVPEFSSLITKLVSDLSLFDFIDTSIFKDGISDKFVPTNTLEDGMSYRFAGVPYFVNKPEVEDSWIRKRYHTKYDDADTWNEDVMNINANIFGALVIYLDQKPALELDFVTTADSMLGTIDENLCQAAGVDTEEFRLTVKKFRFTAAEQNAIGAELNYEYVQALKSDEISQEDVSTDEKVLNETELSETKFGKEKLDELRERAVQHNKKLLKIFKMIQDGIIGIIGTQAIVNKHECVLANIELIQGVLSYLEKYSATYDKRDSDSNSDSNDNSGNQHNTVNSNYVEEALALACQVNAGTDYAYLRFSKETAEKSKSSLYKETNPNNTYWGTDKVVPMADTYEGIMALVEGDIDKAKSVYKRALNHDYDLLKQILAQEINALKSIINN